MAGDRHKATPLAAVDLPDAASTHRFGAWLGSQLRAGDAVALVGELGAGKTSLVRGLAEGLGVDDPDAVSSPTYLLVVEHAGPLRLLHADAYLPAKLAAFLDDGGLEYLFDGGAVAVVEWADQIANLMPAKTLWCTLSPASGGGRRLVAAAAQGADFPWMGNLPKIL